MLNVKLFLFLVSFSTWPCSVKRPTVRYKFPRYLLNLAEGGRSLSFFVVLWSIYHDRSENQRTWWRSKVSYSWILRLGDPVVAYEKSLRISESLLNHECILFQHFHFHFDNPVKIHYKGKLTIGWSTRNIRFLCTPIVFDFEINKKFMPYKREKSQKLDYLWMSFIWHFLSYAAKKPRFRFFKTKMWMFIPKSKISSVNNLYFALRTMRLKN